MSGVRGATILLLTVALAAFTFGCSDGGGGGAAGSGGTAGSGGSGGDGGMGGGGMGGVSGIEANFATSLHSTRVGMETWYDADNGGFEVLTNVPYDELICNGCHDKAANPDWTEPTCGDCHGADDKHLKAETCFGCHGRQRAERANGNALNDVHIDDVDDDGMDGPAKLGCNDCHSADDMHGDGNVYASMLEQGAIDADCGQEGCHTAVTPSGYHTDDHADVACSTCHTEAVVSCINCHFDQEVDDPASGKRANRQVHNWKFLVKYQGEYRPATIMTLAYNRARAGDDRGAHPDDPDPTDLKKTWAVIAPYYAHTVTKAATDGIACTDCHAGFGDGKMKTLCDAIATGTLKLLDWDELATPPMQTGASGLIPVPPDYEDVFRIDYVTWNGSAWEFFEEGPDVFHMGTGITGAGDDTLGRELTQAEFEKLCPP